MKVQIFLRPAVLLVIVAALFGNVPDASAQRRRAPTPFNVTEPINTIKGKVQTLTEKFDFATFLAFVLELGIKCILPLIPSKSMSYGIAPRDIKIMSEELILAVKSASPPTLPEISDFKTFCNTEEFKTIHNHIWCNGNSDGCQFTDMVKFFYHFGNNTIFDDIKNLYERNDCPQDLIATLPSAPSVPPSERTRSSHRRQPSNIKERMLQSQRQNLFQNPSIQSCGIGDIISILQKLPGSGIIQLLDLVATTVQQFETQPSLTFLVGKIQDPIKGRAFRDFRLLPPVKGILTNLHEKMITDNTWKLIFNFIKTQLQLDFFKNNIVDTLISIMEYVLWGTVFPNPSATTPTQVFHR